MRVLIDERTPRVPALDLETMYLEHLASIERIAAFIAHRNHLAADETAEFSQVVRVKLFENDYEIIHKFESRSSFTTYLTTVIARLFHQWRVEQWGEWRPSAAARALGETAIALERLMSRDGFTLPEAVTMLTTRHSQYSVEELEAIYVRLPLRKPRPVLISDETVLAELPGEGSAEERVRAGEREIALHSAAAGLDRALGGFSPDDRLILQLRFWKRMKVPEIARILRLDQRKVFTRLEHLLKALRRALEDEGIDHAAVGELMDQPALDLSLELRPEWTSGSNGDRR
ncbi:MAG TPA: sigma-70 family RNA polymerase sigma factor [Thermoanaerobaculia bacterium]|nr:sigma-70 family RNA polymerase sigma factor [Thermoanaerobaculia bacterium]